MPFISFPKAYAPALRAVIDDYLARSGIDLVPAHEAETLPMVISLPPARMTKMGFVMQNSANEFLYTEGPGRWDFSRFNLQNRKERM